MHAIFAAYKSKNLLSVTRLISLLVILGTFIVVKPIQSDEHELFVI